MERLKASALIVCVVLVMFLDVGCALNDEGVALLRFREGIEADPYGSLRNWEVKDGERDPCMWNGVGCENGRVVSLVLADCGLRGVLSAELGKLDHLKYLILSNNSLYGAVSRGIGRLSKLEVLSLEYNNLSGELPSDLGNLLSLQILRIKGNRFIGTLKDGLIFLERNGDAYVRSHPLSLGRRYLSSRIGGTATIRKLMKESANSIPTDPADAPTSLPSPAPASLNAPASAPYSDAPEPSNKGKLKTGIYVAISLVAFFLVLAFVYGFFLRGKKVITVKPWATGLSGQLQRALIKGASPLKKSELEIASEDFSNIIGSLADGKLYKGTLSSGVEIAISVLTPHNGWTKHSNTQFRRKIEILSKVNHKNFVNLLGYCEEEKPFSRMMVFEYAPNGTLFEHLHIKESQDLTWAARLRIAMGVAYCLDHMHQLNPPIVLENLNSNMIRLTDDFAAKIADLELQSGTTEREADGGSSWSPMAQGSIVHKFGSLLLELISGRPPYSDVDGGLINWASEYLKGSKPVRHMVDPSLSNFNDLDAANIVEIAKACLNPNPRRRLSIKEVVRRLRDITSISPEDAAPKLSPLWWAELEIDSSE